MKTFRIAMTLAIMACLLPAVGVFTAASIARIYGCTLHEGFVTPCVVMGRDIGATLYAMGVLGWLMLLTVPVGTVLTLVWAAVEIWRRVTASRQTSI